MIRLWQGRIRSNEISLSACSCWRNRSLSSRESVRSQRASLTWLWSCNGFSSSGAVILFKIQESQSLERYSRLPRKKPVRCSHFILTVSTDSMKGGSHQDESYVDWKSLKWINITLATSLWLLLPIKVFPTPARIDSDTEKKHHRDIFRLLLQLASLAPTRSIKLSRRLPNDITSDCNSFSNSYLRLQRSQVETDAYWQTLANSTTSSARERSCEIARAGSIICEA